MLVIRFRLLGDEMGQPNKGQRHLLQSRVPMYLVDPVQDYAAAHGMSVSEAVADLVARALDQPLPSTTVPRPKSQTQRQREELPLGMSA